MDFLSYLRCCRHINQIYLIFIESYTCNFISGGFTTPFIRVFSVVKIIFVDLSDTGFC